MSKSKSQKPYKRPKNKALILRTNSADLTSYGGFKWPASGPVSAPDWSPVAECGAGLHGLLWGEGDGKYLDWSEDAKWIVAEVDPKAVVDISAKVKFPSAKVVFCGERVEALAFLAAHIDRPDRIYVGGTATAGDRGTATAGDSGTLAIKEWDGARYLLRVAYVGEDGIKASVAYRIQAGKFVEAQ